MQNMGGCLTGGRVVSLSWLIFWCPKSGSLTMNCCSDGSSAELGQKTLGSAFISQLFQTGLVDAGDARKDWQLLCVGSFLLSSKPDGPLLCSCRAVLEKQIEYAGQQLVIRVTFLQPDKGKGHSVRQRGSDARRLLRARVRVAYSWPSLGVLKPGKVGERPLYPCPTGKPLSPG